MTTIWEALGVAGFTAAATLGSAWLGGWTNLRSARESNAQALRMRSAELSADATARAEDADERRRQSIRDDIRSAHVALTAGLQGAMHHLNLTRNVVQVHHAGTLAGKAQEALIEAAAPLETLDILLSEDAADAARALYVHVATVTNDAIDFGSRRAGQVLPPDIDTAELRYAELRKAYAALVRRDLGRQDR